MKFLLSALPRSGTTWAANWLSANGVLCLHEPLYRSRPDEVMDMDVGVSCTGMWLTDKKITCPHVIIERPLPEVNDSLHTLGMPAVPRWMAQKFAELQGPRFHFKELFTEEGARAIWGVLRSDEFDPARHRELTTYNIQPDFRRWQPNPTIMHEVMAGLR